ncbi:MAG: arsenate reductase ArsC [Spirochaetia bacterium]
MTEEFIRLECGDRVEVESAGVAPGTVNPVVVALLAEDGIDITGKRTQSVYDLHAAGKSFDYVIAVCDTEAAERCPVFPAEKKRLHWPFPDPSKATGSMEEQLAYVRPIRDEIRAAVADFCRQLGTEDTRSGTEDA